MKILNLILKQTKTKTKSAMKSLMRKMMTTRKLRNTQTMTIKVSLPAKRHCVLSTRQPRYK